MPNDNYIPIIRGLSANDYYVGAEAGAFNLYSPGVGSFIAYCAFIWRGTGQVYSGGASSPPVPQYIWGNYSDGYGAGPRGWALSIEAVDGYAVLRATMADATGAIVTADLPLTGGNSQGNPFGHLMFASVTVTATTLFLTLNGAIAAASPVAALLGAAPNPPRLGCNPFDASDPAINIDVIGCGHTALSFTDANVGESADTTFRSFLAGFGQSSVGPADGINWNHRYTVDGQALPSTVVKNSAGAYVTALGVGPATLVDHGNDSPNPGLVVPGLTAVALNRVGSPTVTSNRAPQFYGSRTFDSLSPAPTPPASATIIDIYVSPALGDDSNPGTQADPLATLEAAEALIPQIMQAQYNIHLRNETYTLVRRPSLFRSRTVQNGGRAYIFADESWDPTVFNVSVTQVSQAGTGGSTVVGVGFVVGAEAGKSIRFTTGAAVGQVRRVNDNTGTDLALNNPFSPAPAPGDTFELFELGGSTIVIPDTSFGAVPWTLVESCGSQVPQLSNLLFAATSFEGVAPAVCFEGVIFSSATFSQPLIYADTEFTGVSIDGAFPRAMGGATLSGGVLPIQDQKRGWGVRILFNAGNALGADGGNLALFIHDALNNGFFIANGSAYIVGGRLAKTSGCFAQNSHTYFRTATTTKFLIPAAGGDLAIALDASASTVRNDNRFVSLANATLSNGITVGPGATLFLDSTVTSTAGAAVLVTGGGRLICFGAPTYGDGAATDWTVQGVAAFNKAALAGLHSAVLGTDGSFATRGQ